MENTSSWLRNILPVLREDPKFQHSDDKPKNEMVNSRADTVLYPARDHSSHVPVPKLASMTACRHSVGEIIASLFRTPRESSGLARQTK